MQSLSAEQQNQYNKVASSTLKTVLTKTIQLSAILLKYLIDFIKSMFSMVSGK